ncbi:antitermination protein [Pantoea agglomerans]|uniref:antitermination protein Q n=1 Tax=Enterobacter agglomerans TaxID=549 RepID=UPI0003B19DEB|nr:antitermination protein [Pantoea agglomerans]ERM09611.1 antitermination protein [Pantoea agglomerans Tx10]QAV46886.1 antitermination protein [Pantoea agglomerans]QAV51447.1 antitermination protein [Pantoea agglomerans]WNK60334.1 antitermination protein [Pantoea agglomerans]
MKLESVVKYHSPRSVSPFTRQSSRSPGDMLGSDVMAALGMTQKRAPLGYSAFFGKMQLSHHDRDRAVGLLTKTGMKASVHYPALSRLPEDERMAVVTVIAGYAFLDYARSPDSESPCHACHGTGLRNGKYCSKCNGKGVVRAACKDCKGRGEAVNRVMTRFQGVPVYQPCKRCSGRGFERIPSAVVFRAVCQVTQAVTLDTWNKSVKQLLEFLVAELHREEAWAEKTLSRITK